MPKSLSPTIHQPRLAPALPALVFGIGALLLAAYGAWVQPGRLAGQYRKGLIQNTQKYDQLMKLPAKSMDWNSLLQSASTVDIIYRRLQTFEPSNLDRLWELAKFQQKHVSLLQSRLPSMDSKVSAEVKSLLENQRASFERQAKRSIEQVAASNSKYRRDAILSVVDSAIYADGISKEILQSRKQSLKELLVSDQLDSEVLIQLARLTIEEAWSDSFPSVTLKVDVSKLEEALGYVERIQPSERIERRALRCLILADLDPIGAISEADSVWTLTGRGQKPNSQKQVDSVAGEERTRIASQSSHDTESRAIPSEVAERLRFANEMESRILIACVRGDWSEVVRGVKELLEVLSESPESIQRVRHLVTRTVCRLSVSKLARTNDPWSARYADGFRIASQLDPFASVYAAVLWQLALQHSGQLDPEAASFSDSLLQSVLSSGRDDNNQLVLAIASILKRKPEVAKLHLQIAQKQDRRSIQAIAQIGLWYIQREDQYLARWIEIVQIELELEPKEGIGWFALGAMQMKNSAVDDAIESLKKAKSILGVVPVIEEMLKKLERK